MNSITEGIKLQTQNRQQRPKKAPEESQGETSTATVANSQGEPSNPPSTRSTPSPVPSHSSTASKPATKRAQSVMTTSEKSEDSESASEMTELESNADTEVTEDGNDEIELVFKPHPTEMSNENVLMKALKENTVRYLKTTANATIEHLSKYLAMRLTLDAQLTEPELKNLVFTIHVANSSAQLVALSGSQTLQQVNEKFWKVGLGWSYF